MNTRRYISYALVVLIVVILGALAGWYYVLHGRSAATAAIEQGRGFSAGQTELGSPFGGGGGGASGAAATTSPASPPPQLWHVTSEPVAGFGFATSSDGLLIRYATRAQGYIFEANASTSATTRLTDTLIPKTYEAIFGTTDRVVMRSVDAGGSVSTFAGLFGAATSSALLTTKFPAAMEAVAPDPKSMQVFTASPQGSGVAGITSAWDGSKQKQIFVSGVAGWRAWWLPDGRIILAQKAADSLQGYSYEIRNGVQNDLVRGPGLTIAPRAGGALLFGFSQGGTLSLYVQLSASTSAVRLPLSTPADKCAWAPNGEPVAYCGVPQTPTGTDFLDRWYRGEVHSADAIWKIDARSGQAQQIFTPDGRLSLDVVDPQVDDSGAYLGFMNAADQSLWLLRLNK